MYPINHDKLLNTEAGYLALNLTPFSKSGLEEARVTTPGITRADRNAKFKVDLRDEDRDHLMTLLYFIGYTWEGRQLCRANKAGRWNLVPAVARIDADRPDTDANWEDPYYDDATITLNLSNEFRKYISNDALINSLVRVQIAASYWTAYHQGLRKDGNQAAQEALWAAEYQQHMSFIMWSLWEDFMDHEFSIFW